MKVSYSDVSAIQMFAFQIPTVEVNFIKFCLKAFIARLGLLVLEYSIVGLLFLFYLIFFMFFYLFLALFITFSNSTHVVPIPIVGLLILKYSTLLGIQIVLHERDFEVKQGGYCKVA